MLVILKKVSVLLYNAMQFGMVVKQEANLPIQIAPDMSFNLTIHQICDNWDIP